MKIIAWSERNHQVRRKDAEDLLFVMLNYIDVCIDDALTKGIERVANNYSEWFQLEDFDYQYASARLLGMDMRQLATDKLRVEVSTILDHQIGEGAYSNLVNEMA